MDINLIQQRSTSTANRCDKGKEKNNASYVHTPGRHALVMLGDAAK
jgi:hypothetical protein